MIDFNTFDPQVIVVDGLTVGPRLGAGGQKAVWRCDFRGQAHALKVLAADDASTERAKRELEVYRRCDSPYLPKLGPLPLSTVTVAGDTALFYVEQFIEGIPLNQVAKPIPPEQVIQLGLCVSAAIEELWKHRFVHRDIKPANIVQNPTGNQFVLLDAGLVLDSLGPSLTQTGGIVGTTGYRSPDQLQMQKRELDFRSDLFALGICMYECLTNQHPFWNSELPTGDVHYNTVNHACPHPKHWNPALEDRLCEVVMRLLEKERHMRYSRISHLQDELR